jgi:hypothetical protein
MLLSQHTMVRACGVQRIEAPLRDLRALVARPVHAQLSRRRASAIDDGGKSAFSSVAGVLWLASHVVSEGRPFVLREAALFVFVLRGVPASCGSRC